MPLNIILFISKYLFYPIIIGVISTVTYVLVFDKLFIKILLPWYFSRKYKSTLIGGRWSGTSNNFKFEMNLRQTGDRVEGEIVANTITKLKAQNEKEGIKIIDKNEYVFQGEIKDGFVRIIHKEKDRNSFGFGCFLFQIAGGGKVLNGSVVFVDESDESYSVTTEKDIKLGRL